MICLKTRTFAVSQTTLFFEKIAFCMLWFAWKLVLLQYRKQHIPSNTISSLGCDLLENSYFCSIANNHWTIMEVTRIVVICLKTRTFAVSQTTVRLYLLIPQQLWFAWKLVLLQYRKQHSIALSRLLICCDLLENSYFCSIANNI